MLGPFPVVGDCVSEEERLAMAFIEFEPIHDGDLAIWYMPSREVNDQYASKWLIADSAGEFWLACKYFAVRYRAGFHIPVARVVCIVAGDVGSLDDELSARMASEIRELREAKPARADLVTFPQDFLGQDQIRSAIDEHRRRWLS